MRSLAPALQIGMMALVLHVLAPTPGPAEEQRAPEQRPPEQPAKEPRVMSIYFDQGATEIGATAQKILAFVKNDLKPAARVTITGHSDMSEAEPDKLSLARAISVLDALVALGVPPRVAFTVVGRGTSAPRKKTGPNVAEPINRSAAIVIR